MPVNNAIDPDFLRFIEAMREDWKDHPPLESMSYPEQRAAAEAVRERWRQGGPAMAQTEETTFGEGAEALKIRIYRPETSKALQPALVYLHGGGFTLFSIDTHDRLMREYAARGGFTVIGIDYPLAPEAKYPVALNAITNLMTWLGRHGTEWAVDPERIAMGGDSAGGNLSFATCLRLRDAGKLSIVKAILSNYGGFSSQISDEAEERFGGPGSIMDRAEARQYWANYLRSEADEDDPYACPLLADLSGFPPVLQIVPEIDIVAEHSLEMHERLKASGVEADCIVYPGAIHSFLEAMSISPVARKGIEDGAYFIAQSLGVR